jgi:hypothetical protein
LELEKEFVKSQLQLSCRRIHIEIRTRHAEGKRIALNGIARVQSNALARLLRRAPKTIFPVASLDNGPRVSMGIGVRARRDRRDGYESDRRNAFSDQASLPSGYSIHRPLLFGDIGMASANSFVQISQISAAIRRL